MMEFIDYVMTLNLSLKEKHKLIRMAMSIETKTIDNTIAFVRKTPKDYNLGKLWKNFM